MNPKKISQNLALSLFIGLVIFVVIKFFSLNNIRYDYIIKNKSTSNTIDKNIVLITVDENTLKTYGEPTFWTRSRYESLLAELESQKPKAVIFDYYFNTKTNPENVDWDLIQNTSGLDTISVDNIFEMYDNALKDKDFFSSIDRDFIVAVRKGGNVFFPMLTTFDRNNQIKGIKIESFEQLKNHSRNGYVNTLIDNDGTLRKFPLLKSTDYKPLSLAVANYFTKTDIKLDPNNIYYINYSSAPTKGFDKITFELAYNGIFETKEGKKLDLKDKIIIIGDYGEIFGDYYKVPVGDSSFMPGMEVLATQIKTLLDNSIITDIGNLNRILVNIVLFILFFITFYTLRILASTIIFALINILLIYLDYKFFSSGLYMSYIYFTPVLFGTYLSPLITNILNSYSEKSRLKKFFSKFVGKNMVDLLIKTPNLNLDGEKREVTVFFADLKNFTSISEKLEPEIVVDILDTIFQEANRIIFAHAGTLDKYIGDCIMAFWGAPTQNENHAKEACIVALELIQSINLLNKDFLSKYGFELTFRIGISTGNVTVGSIGTDEFADYTVIGDKVNLASRLESINKVYNTNILITEDTLAKLDEDFVTREIDTIKVKGKQEPITIYELLDYKGQHMNMTNFSKIVSNHKKGLKLYTSGRLIEAKTVFKENKKLGDNVAEAFLDRINDMDVRKNWDGVWEFSEK